MLDTLLKLARLDAQLSNHACLLRHCHACALDCRREPLQRPVHHLLQRCGQRLLMLLLNVLLYGPLPFLGDPHEVLALVYPRIREFERNRVRLNQLALQLPQVLPRCHKAAHCSSRARTERADGWLFQQPTRKSRNSK